MDDDRLVATFVELADTMVDDFDPSGFLQLLVHRCTEVLGIDSAGLMLADEHGRLRVMAATSERARLLEAFQLTNSEGPCLDAFRTGSETGHPALPGAATRWALFAPAAMEAGFAAVHALPMRLRGEVIGALDLFGGQPGELTGPALRMTRALVAMATIGLLQERSLREAEQAAEQLQDALNSRVVVEQATGMLAERLRTDVAAAAAVLRDYAHGHDLGLGDVAEMVVVGRISTDDLRAHLTARPT